MRQVGAPRFLAASLISADHLPGVPFIHQAHEFKDAPPDLFRVAL